MNNTVTETRYEVHTWTAAGRTFATLDAAMEYATQHDGALVRRMRDSVFCGSTGVVVARCYQGIVCLTRHEMALQAQRAE